MTFGFYHYLCCPKEEMKISRQIQHLILWVMLAAVTVAYTGKALHTHSESYYDSLRSTRSATSNGMSDDCPICHFNLLLFFFAQHSLYTFYTTLLTIIFAAQVIMRSKEVVGLFSNRAPPVLL